MSSNLIIAKVINSLTETARNRAKTDLITRPRVRTSSINRKTHDREQELVIGGQPADVSYTITRTTLDYEPPVD